MVERKIVSRQLITKTDSCVQNCWIMPGFTAASTPSKEKRAEQIPSMYLRTNSANRFILCNTNHNICVLISSLLYFLFPGSGWAGAKERREWEWENCLSGKAELKTWTLRSETWLFNCCCQVKRTNEGNYFQRQHPTVVFLIYNTVLIWSNMCRNV